MKGCHANKAWFLAVDGGDGVVLEPGHAQRLMSLAFCDEMGKRSLAGERESKTDRDSVMWERKIGRESRRRRI